MNLPPSLQKYLRVVRFHGYGSRMRPMRDWLVILILSGALLVISVSWNIWFFLSTVSGEQAATTTQETETVDTSSVEAATEAFTERAAKIEEYRNTRFVDPARE